MRVSDYIAKRLNYLGCTDVYMVTGGMAMHLNDAFSRLPGLKIHNLHHEQSCSIAAESYARIKFKPALLNVTAGPGAINAINGVFGAYVDSIPMIIISGQSKRETLVTNSGLEGLRQLGDQEVDIVKMVENICKYSVLVQEPNEIDRIIDHAFMTATTGRPGPVWIDVPIDVQGTLLPDRVKSQVEMPLSLDKYKTKEPYINNKQLQQIAIKLLTSKRPILYVGNGIRLSESYKEFLDFLDDWKIPTVTNWNSNDLLWDGHLSYCGRPGSIGNRTGNFAVQFSDCVITIGARLNIRQVSYNWKSFAKNAWKCHIDIDIAELEKPTLSSDLKVLSSINGLFRDLTKSLKEQINKKENNFIYKDDNWSSWRLWLKQKMKEYPICNNELIKNSSSINPYLFINHLFKHLNDNEIIACADGTACVVGFQAAVIKPGQRLFHNSGCASMGYELPAAIGAYHATSQRIVCIAGDGSIMMNLQELAYIGGKKLPIIIFLLNNDGYHSIRQTQNNYFKDNIVGCGIESGLPFPNFKDLCQGFGIDYYYSNNEENLDISIQKSLSFDKPILHEIIINKNQEFSPKLSSRKLDDGTMLTSELEDMAPFLSDNQMKKILNEAMSL